MERMQSEWEHRVKYNLTESGVRPLDMKELIPDKQRQDIWNKLIHRKLHHPSLIPISYGWARVFTTLGNADNEYLLKEFDRMI